MFEKALESLSEPKKSAVRGMLRDITSNCQSYLSGTIVRDNFGNNHSARRIWWQAEVAKENSGEFRRRYGSNKLRLNNISGVSSFLEALVYTLDEFEIRSPEVELVRKLLKMLPNLDNYGEISDEEKLEIVAKIEQIAKSFLELVGEVKSAGE